MKRIGTIADPQYTPSAIPTIPTAPGAASPVSDPASYLTLFTSALLAATILPAQSELVLVGLLLAGGQPPGLLILVATTGNVLGAAVNWALGRALDRLHDRPWFPVKPSALERAQRFYHRYGRWSLLLSWMPVIGDP